MATTNKLKTAVHLRDEETGRMEVLEAGTEVDKKTKGRITDKAFYTKEELDGDEDTGGDDPPVVEQPAKNASHEEWVAYATTVDENLSAEDAKALNRDELVERYHTED